MISPAVIQGNNRPHVCSSENAGKLILTLFVRGGTPFISWREMCGHLRLARAPQNTAVFTRGMELEHPFDLSGKTALVTGAGRNIGRAIALEFAGLGANVVINARSNTEEAQAVRAEAEAKGVKAIVVMGDMNEKSTI